MKAIEKYRYGLWKTISKHLKRDDSQRRFVKIAQRLLTINIQRLLCTVIMIKFHAGKEAKEAKEVLLYFAQDF